jgi:succinate dehydrogenase/fumarate reductase flavoprotein subunit
MAAPPATFSTAEFVDVTQYYGPSAIAVDETGRRFVDESACTGEEDLAVATARDADGLAYYLLDAELYESALDTSSLQVATIVDRADAAGGRVVSADSRSGLRSAVADWSLNGDQLLETLDTYNAAMRDGSSLTPPRTTDRRPFETPPFYVVGVQPGITFATGGLAVDEDMAVLSRARSSSTLEQSPQDSSPVRLASIEGLYAAGADVGNVHNGGYFGGLATALVTGRIAGTAAVDRVTGHDAPTS